MILIDAIFINNGGGKVLLDYLVEKLEETNLGIVYLFDDRIILPYKIKSGNTAIYQSSSLKLRNDFYKNNKRAFDKIFIMGNIPPLIKMVNVTVYTYFHNRLYLEVPNEFSVIEKIKYFFKVQIIKRNSRNTDFWLLQSQTLKEQFVNRFRQENKIKVLPFYQVLKAKNHKIERQKNTFIYVSNAQDNKNHKRLITAFCNAFDNTKTGKLILTVSDKFPLITTIISEAVLMGYPIENIGFVNREFLTEKYLESEYVIFPSLAESFGLGLVEGIELGCKIIGADLPYTYAVCVPSLVFDPSNIDSISNSIALGIQNSIAESKLKVEDNIFDLIKLLS
ncbi:glycosyltransferase [Pedobacter sp. 22226]|uniref:glycosyltransferase n=1 Tax=Pedobacter sp. 22226 TaxID=3453894 RepID=UPI003F860A90